MYPQVCASALSTAELLQVVVVTAAAALMLMLAIHLNSSSSSSQVRMRALSQCLRPCLLVGGSQPILVLSLGVPQPLVLHVAEAQQRKCTVEACFVFGLHGAIVFCQH